MEEREAEVLAAKVRLEDQEQEGPRTTVSVQEELEAGLEVLLEDLALDGLD